MLREKNVNNDVSKDTAPIEPFPKAILLMWYSVLPRIMLQRKFLFVEDEHFLRNLNKRGCTLE